MDVRYDLPLRLLNLHSQLILAAFDLSVLCISRGGGEPLIVFCEYQEREGGALDSVLCILYQEGGGGAMFKDGERMPQLLTCQDF